ncbi:MAG: class I SAM-dependent methyltransferase [Candidatus Omnitrophica bacterium]|nr:class I SAM-dependent methyltransferase [Candidatus Omnitrophota bacterium]
MAHIGILVHEQDRFQEETYFLRHISQVWREMGFSVSVHNGIAERFAADLLFLHVDLTVIPLDYLAFARAFPHSVNTSTGDIRKSQISPNVLERSDLFGGRVIIKTDNNCGGYKEANLAAQQSLGGRWQRWLDDKLPWRMRAQTLYTYPILKATSKVPRKVWDNPQFVVEKFRPEKQDDLYALRTWVFLGDRETHSICYAKEPVVKSSNVIRREELGDVPQELRRRRDELGFAFGKFDYAINKGEVVLFDVNPTPTLGAFATEEFMPGIRKLAEGIHSLLPGDIQRAAAALAARRAPSPLPPPAGTVASAPPPPPAPGPAPQAEPSQTPQPPGMSMPAIAPEYPAPDRSATPSPVPVAPGDPGYWDKIAANWRLVGPPLRPAKEDLNFVTAELQKMLRPRALILGVTPELYDLAWPYGTELQAVDHNQIMIDTIWPGPADSARCGEWTALPFEDGSKDVVVCDGGFHLLSYPDGQQALVRELHRVLAPEGLFIVRLFTPPVDREDTVFIIADLVQGKIPNLNLLKLRLAMAMQPDPVAGVAVHDIWEKLNRDAGPWKNLAALVNWPLEHLEAIDAYQDSPNRYHFVDTEQIKRIFTRDPGGFEHTVSHVPVYPLGERCPTLIFRKNIS